MEFEGHIFQGISVRAGIPEADVAELDLELIVLPFLHRQRAVIHLVRQIQIAVYFQKIIIVLAEAA